MTRLRDIDIEWGDLEKIARHYALKLQYRRALCEHRRTRDQVCRSCEAGMVWDTSPYANLPQVADLDSATMRVLELTQYDENDRAMVAVSVDLNDVAFISKAQMDRLARRPSKHRG